MFILAHDWNSFYSIHSIMAGKTERNEHWYQLTFSFLPFLFSLGPSTQDGGIISRVGLPLRPLETTLQIYSEICLLADSKPTDADEKMKHHSVVLAEK